MRFLYFCVSAFHWYPCCDQFEKCVLKKKRVFLHIYEDTCMYVLIESHAMYENMMSLIFYWVCTFSFCSVLLWSEDWVSSFVFHSIVQVSTCICINYREFIYCWIDLYMYTKNTNKFTSQWCYFKNSLWCLYEIFIQFNYYRSTRYKHMHYLDIYLVLKITPILFDRKKLIFSTLDTFLLTRFSKAKIRLLKW